MKEPAEDGNYTKFYSTLDNYFHYVKENQERIER
jgi:hypothetical protein